MTNRLTKDKHLSHRVSGETDRQLEALVQHWRCSRTEAVTRAIQMAYGYHAPEVEVPTKRRKEVITREEYEAALEYLDANLFDRQMVISLENLDTIRAYVADLEAIAARCWEQCARCGGFPGRRFDIEIRPTSEMACNRCDHFVILDQANPTEDEMRNGWNAEQRKRRNP